MMETKDDAVKAGYKERVNKAVNFIDLHLEEELSLEKVAEAACYSPFHFHRIFRSVMNEPLNVYISRKRIEKAASVLMRRKEITVTELSVKFGFNGNSSFTRAFKKFYGMSPTTFRNRCPDRFSKIGITDSKNGQMKVKFEKYICDLENQKNKTEMDTNIELKELPEMKLAYISHVGHDHLGLTFKRLLNWAGQKGLLNSPGFKMLNIYHDSFKITAADKVRMSACILLEKPVETGGEIGLKTIGKGKYVIGHFEIRTEEFGNTWTELYIWLNKNGYQTTEKNPFEIYHNDGNTHPEKKFKVDLCIPVA